MIDRDHDLPIIKQAKALGISRGSVYYRPRPVSAAALAVMRRMDELHLEFPFAGSRMLRDLLNKEGVEIGRRCVATLMKRMGIEALYRKPDTSKPAPGHKIYPYLLRGMTIDRPNQVRAMDLTYVPMARGFVYLAAVIDWFSRRVLAWRLSITLEAAFCVEALEEALARHGRPEIFNTDQGSQFTGEAFTGVLTRNGIAISMDGKGAWRDNVFVERLWRSVKYAFELTTRSPRPAPRSAGISASTTPTDRIRALTGRRRIEPTSPGCRRSRRLEPGRGFTYRAGKTVRIDRASSKRRLVAETLASGETVHGVARRSGVSPSQLFGWRKRFGAGIGRGVAAARMPGFAAVEIGWVLSQSANPQPLQGFALRRRPWPGPTASSTSTSAVPSSASSRPAPRRASVAGSEKEPGYFALGEWVSVPIGAQTRCDSHFLRPGARGSRRGESAGSVVELAE